MTIEVTPLGVRCNLSCTYCYQNPMRDAGNFGDKGYDMEAMITTIRKHNSRFTVFGGDPLLVPLSDLKRLWKVGQEVTGGNQPNGIQTNGALITPAHVEAFKKFGVHVGFSLDGPGTMNDHRWAGSLEKTRLATAKSQEWLETCLARGVRCSLILTLHKHNAKPEDRERLFSWLLDLDKRGLSGLRVHLLEIDHSLVEEHLALTDEENIEVLLDLHKLEARMRVNFDIFTDIRALLRGDDQGATCIWNACDPYTTAAVTGVDGQGNASNCGRTNKDGIAYNKSHTPGYERYLSLYNTPQEYKGCKGCRFFSMCKGQCPGTGMDQDWRNRTDRCLVWMRLFELIEKEMLEKGEAPLSLAAHRVAVEERLVEGWTVGQNWSLSGAMPEVVGGASKRGTEKEWEHWDGPNYHGDHTDAEGQPPDRPHGDHEDTGDQNIEHGDAVHGDEPHGDEPHGDDPGYSDNHSDSEADAEEEHCDSKTELAPHGDNHGDGQVLAAPHGDHYDGGPHGDEHNDGHVTSPPSKPNEFQIPIGHPGEKQ